LDLFWPKNDPKGPDLAIRPPQNRGLARFGRFLAETGPKLPKTAKSGGIPPLLVVLGRFGPFWTVLASFWTVSTCFGLEKRPFGGSGTSNRCPTPDNFRSLFRLALSVQNSGNRLLEGNPPHPPPPPLLGVWGEESLSYRPTTVFDSTETPPTCFPNDSTPLLRIL